MRCIRTVSFPRIPGVRAVARRLYDGVHALPIISPHGHTDPRWFADNTPFSDPVSLLLTPDHYITRMLYSQGLSLEQFGVSPLAAADHAVSDAQQRAIWRTFAEHYYLFRGTPTRLWLDWVLSAVFQTEAPLTPANAERAYDRITECLAQDGFSPPRPLRALRDRSARDHRLAAR